MASLKNEHVPQPVGKHVIYTSRGSFAIFTKRKKVFGDHWFYLNDQAQNSSGDLHAMPFHGSQEGKSSSRNHVRQNIVTVENDSCSLKLA